MYQYYVPKEPLQVSQAAAEAMQQEQDNDSTYVMTNQGEALKKTEKDNDRKQESGET